MAKGKSAMTAAVTPGRYATFNAYSDLPEPVRKHLSALEDFIGDCDGKDTVLWNSDPPDTCVDDGSIDATEAVHAFNEIVAALRLAAKPAMRTRRRKRPTLRISEFVCSRRCARKPVYRWLKSAPQNCLLKWEMPSLASRAALHFDPSPLRENQSHERDQNTGQPCCVLP
jgi:hypothetical protein